MSLLGKLVGAGKSLLKVGRKAITGALDLGLGAIGGMIPGPVGTAIGAIDTARTLSQGAPVTTAGTGGGGLTQTLPVLQTGGIVGSGTPTPGGLMRQLGQVGGAMLAQSMGIAPGRGMTRTKVGRLTGNMIPAGYVEKMSNTGVIYLAKQRRRRGISARDLSSFYRVNRLVSKIHGRAHRSSRRGK